MGSVCCCFHVEEIEHHNINGSNNRDCICPNCFIHNLANKYAAVFGGEERHAAISSIQGASSLTSAAVLDNRLSETTRCPPSPLSRYADSWSFNLQQDGQVSIHEKDTGHSHENSESLKNGNVHMGEEFVIGGDKPHEPYCEGGSEQCHSESSVKPSVAEMAKGVGYVYASPSEDEDVCPTCLEEYTPENPKIIAQCSHHFHLGCIYDWMERSESCPFCGKWMMFDEK
ncbi:hypothetical protein L1049_012649 [Liquidambar formosana]|uniref:RING-type E3 ubiquitin transferase n=1 Tax=Liquidambar formosana TaxID=63359 RepID=A0AAP0R5S6_LIQFO